MLEIRNQKLLIDGMVIGDEDHLFEQFEKAAKYDEVMAATNFKGGESQ